MPDNSNQPSDISAEPASPEGRPADPLARAPAEELAGPVAASENKTRPVDFRAPAPLSGPAQRQLRVRHEECARALATRLSIYLRLDCRVSLAGLEPVRCRAWLNRLTNPSHFTLFTLEAQPGLGLMELPPKLGFILVDRLLGGSGEPENVERGLSEVEVTVLDEVVQIFLREWHQQLNGPSPQRLALAGHETNSHFIELAAPEALLLGLVWEVTLSGQSQQIHMAVPFPMLDPLLSQLAVAAPPEPNLQAPLAAPVWNSALDQVRLPLTARCEDFEVPARRLACLQVGDVLPIEPALLNRVEIRLATIPKFVGRLGRQGDHRAVELTFPIKK